MYLKRTIAGLMLVPLLAACGGDSDEGGGEDGGDGEDAGQEQEATGSASAGAGSGALVDLSEEFEEYSDGAAAVTYDTEMVPAGSRVDLTVTADDDGDGDGEEGGEGGGTEFDLDVSGLAPDHEFGAHMHSEPCGENPDDSGPHYQNDQDPEQPSTDPQYANDDNEVWLDFSTDADGNGDSDTDVDWSPRADDMRSFVIHTQHTATAEGEAGTAGDRLACVTVDLNQ